jgi:hypothetical protein
LALRPPFKFLSVALSPPLSGFISHVLVQRDSSRLQARFCPVCGLSLLLVFVSSLASPCVVLWPCVGDTVSAIMSAPKMIVACDAPCVPLPNLSVEVWWQGSALLLQACGICRKRGVSAMRGMYYERLELLLHLNEYHGGLDFEQYFRACVMDAPRCSLDVIVLD